jgi:hypothetical protein
MPSTSAQIPEWLHHKLSVHVAAAQVEDPTMTKSAIICAAIEDLPDDCEALLAAWDSAERLTLKRGSNPGRRRTYDLPEDVAKRLRQLYSNLVNYKEGARKLDRQELISLAIYRALED